jgi:colanic acid/amylovoran biosynthesis glycosyltransferase
MTPSTLLLMPSCEAGTPEPGLLRTGKKFLDGAALHARNWPGTMKVLIAVRAGGGNDPDARTVAVQDLPFSVVPLDGTDALLQALREASVVSSALLPQTTRLSEICKSVGVPLVYVTEYSLLTRKQMIGAETGNPLLRLRRTLWTSRLEERYRRALQSARGVQCNGTPTYQAYRQLSESPLLFFDSRVSSSMLVPERALEDRLDEMRRGGPLRLVFSGRLTAIKGVDHLPAIARELRNLGVPFKMDVYGAGDLASSLQTDIARSNLGDAVRLRGFIDFEAALVPRLSEAADLFVCCHRQGDPSCTYLETLSCGVPIVGYDNEALRGVAELSNACWTVPLDEPERVAQVIADLARQRERLAQASRAARHFGSLHLFEQTLQRRTEHLIECSGTPTLGRA